MFTGYDSGGFGFSGKEYGVLRFNEKGCRQGMGMVKTIIIIHKGG